jgi:hypothetical protein
MSFKRRWAIVLAIATVSVLVGGAVSSQADDTLGSLEESLVDDGDPGCNKPTASLVSYNSSTQRVSGSGSFSCNHSHTTTKAKVCIQYWATSEWHTLNCNANASANSTSASASVSADAIPCRLGAFFYRIKTIGSAFRADDKVHRRVKRGEPRQVNQC